MALRLDVQQFAAAVPSEFRAMTYPAYRHLLDLEPQPRHPTQGDHVPVRPVAIGAYLQGTPLGFVLAEMPLAPDRSAELLSVYTANGARSQGIATHLIALLEEYLTAAGQPRVQAVYMTGKPSIAALERVLTKRDWQGPATRAVTLRFTPEEASTTPWYGRFRLDERLYEIFPWAELGGEERKRLQASHVEQPWIRPGLEFWIHDAYGFDERSSVGVRYRGNVVGWVINHRIKPDMVRFTCSFIRRDLGRRGRIMPVFTESIERLRGTDCHWCTFVTPVRYDTMVRFVKRRCASWVSFFGETKEYVKRLPDHHE